MRLCLLFAWLILGSSLDAQTEPTTSISAHEALHQVDQSNVLTYEAKPFHAVLKISPEKQADPSFQATIELFWQDAKNYQLQIESPQFGQKLTVGSGIVSEIDRGDFYPNWINNFVLAITDPIPHRGDLGSLNQSVVLGKMCIPAYGAMIAQEGSPIR